MPDHGTVLASPLAGGTKIEWTDFTWSPWHGCEKVSPACAHCYAEGIARRYDGPGHWGAGHEFKFQSDAYWDKPLRWARTAPAKLGRRPRVFCASMADVFEDRDEISAARFRLLSLIIDTPELDWLVLTKRPEFARDWLERAFTHKTSYDSGPLPPNLWMGVSIENSRFTWRADILREIPAAVRFISAEPLLGSLIDATPPHPAIAARAFMAGNMRIADAVGPRKPLDLTDIDWVIIGGESGPRSRPTQLLWIDDLIANCREFDVAIFIKQLGTVWAKHVRRDYGLLADAKGGDPEYWPERLRIREHPESAA